MHEMYSSNDLMVYFFQNADDADLTDLGGFLKVLSVSIRPIRVISVPKQKKAEVATIWFTAPADLEIKQQ